MTMTRQEYYEKLRQAAYDGTFPSVVDSNCRYRATGEATCPQRCALGILIPDNVYDRNIEGLGLCARPLGDDKIYQLLNPYFPQDLSRQELHEIQEAHDSCARVIPWDPKAFMERIDKIFYPTPLLPSP